jgi:glyceraldehyde 3-phosphate dehydrogenase
MSIRVGINGMGRIGRDYLRYALDSDDIDVVAVNDIADSLTLARLLRHDSTFGPLRKQVDLDGSILINDGNKIAGECVPRSERAGLALARSRSRDRVDS